MTLIGISVQGNDMNGPENGSNGGSANTSGLAGGSAGKAINLNGQTITWLGGNDATRVKGALN